ncbi:ABC transporter permease [Desulfallas sp. Bu1-1]|jgi:putative ABC transport system permease protein|uniref:ABC transporter permease n=1 Tax=Desulfallas sp. Bu1-1 TaxID=2787620 RepID=UPI00189F40B5|nr:ABC transporter permease [Desulfallas sp. Bu1-1]MBF7084087.1 ABC transporter permease [Desulfallas sp. Bu1-1]
MESVIINALQQGLIFAFMALGVLLTFRLLGFPDLTVEGTFPLGAAVTARVIVEGVNPLLAVLLGAVAGGMAGAATGLMHTRLKVNNILAGILTASAIYTVMLRTMGRPNTPLLAHENVYGQVLGWFNLTETNSTVIIALLVLTVIVRLLLGWFLNTDIGLALRATGSNEQMIRSLGVNTDNTKLMGLIIANFLVGLSGALACQLQGFADVGMGIGVLVAAIASVIVGETIFGGNRLGRLLTGVILGSIVYRGLLAIGLRMGLPAEDFKLMTAVLVLLVLCLPNFSLNKRLAGVVPGVQTKNKKPRQTRSLQADYSPSPAKELTVHVQNDGRVGE